MKAWLNVVESVRPALLRGAVVLAVALPAGVWAQSGSAGFSATRLTADILVVSGESGNAVVGIEPDGLLIIDGAPKAQAQALLDFIRTETGVQRVKTLVNTHWHAEPTGLNEILGKAGTRIIAHENTKQWLAANIDRRGDERIHNALAADALPNTTIYATGELPFRDGKISFGYLLQGHTDGDIYVYFPQANVLVTGGVVASDRWPVIDWWTGGWIGGKLDAFETLLALANADTRIVPASGPVMSRADLDEQYKMYSTLFGQLVVLLKKSRSPAEVVAAAPTSGLHPEWGSPDTFVDAAFRSLFGHLRNDRRVGAMP